MGWREYVFCLCLGKGANGVGDISIRNVAWVPFRNHVIREAWVLVTSLLGMRPYNSNDGGDWRMIRSHCGRIWGQITDFGSFNKEIQEIASKEIRIKVGNAAYTSFWFDCNIPNPKHASFSVFTYYIIFFIISHSNYTK